MNWFKRLFCKHPRLMFHRNIYGDEILSVMSVKHIYRSWWWCPDCGRLIRREELVSNENRSV